MADEVNYTDPPHHPLPRMSWQELGELKLAGGSTPDRTIIAWLINALIDLNLPGDLVSRLLASIEEATARVLNSDSVEDRWEYLEIVVLAPAGEETKGHAWGFFRVEKAAVDPQSESPNGHRVEYYLYLDKR